MKDTSTDLVIIVKSCFGQKKFKVARQISRKPHLAFKAAHSKRNMASVLKDKNLGSAYANSITEFLLETHSQIGQFVVNSDPARNGRPLRNVLTTIL